MLILSRRATECIHLGDDIVLTIVAVGNDKVRIGVKAPPGVRILRTELDEQDDAVRSIPMISQQESAGQETVFELPAGSLKSFITNQRRAA